MSNAKSPALALKQELSSEGMRSQIGAALPKHVPLDTFMRTTMTVVGQNPKLLNCKRDSLFTAVMSCAQLGLMPDAFLGEAYIIPFGQEAQLQIGYKGLLALARRSGDIVSIDSGVAYENDVVTYKMGDESELTIEPCMDGDPGKPKFAWCVIRLKDGGIQREVMSVNEVEKIRTASKSANSPAWKNSWDEMARKTVVKRALKYAPRSTEMSQAVAIDDNGEGGKMVSLVDGQLEVTTEAQADTQPAKVSRLEQLAGQDEVPADVNPETGEVVDGDVA